MLPDERLLVSQKEYALRWATISVTKNMLDGIEGFKV
jgi:hypothetical protein